jgi:hypothetical protein
MRYSAKKLQGLKIELFVAHIADNLKGSMWNPHAGVVRRRAGFMRGAFAVERSKNIQ